MSANPIKPPHVYAGSPLDRGDQVRRDENWIAAKAKDPTSKFLPLLDLNVPILNGAHPQAPASGDPPGLAWISPGHLERLGVDANPVFLGLREQVAYFTVDITGYASAAKELQEGADWRYEDARTATEYLSGPETGIVAQARAQVHWHNKHGFCSVCGGPTIMKRGGQVRLCPECGTEHYPRTDPVVITVVSDGARCLLGQSRGRLARMKMYSALAGFVDQGESIEEAVAREVMEEAGIKVKNIRYHSSQPWPFPSSLMIGCHADAASTQIAMDEEEMADVRWFHRGEVRLALAGNSLELAVPGPIAIAHHLIKEWADGA